MQEIKHKQTGQKISISDLIEGDKLNLDFAAIRSADFKGLKIDNISMRYTWIYDADLKNTVIKNADFFFTTFFDSDLTGINLENANLEETKFINTNLSDANLYGARQLRTQFSGSILDNCKIVFNKFITLPDILSIRLGHIPKNLTEEIMKRNIFDGRAWGLSEQKISNDDLMIEICRFKKWGIEGKL